YLAFHEAVFTAPTRIASAADIDAVARSAGLDIARLHTDMQDPAIANAIERNRALGHALDLSGTPAYVIGSQIIDGAVGYERMKAAITAERSQGETAQNGG
ncbi:MAG: DsbA family protein, partial [Alphaproteobacteria bacterium]